MRTVKQAKEPMTLKDIFWIVASLVIAFLVVMAFADAVDGPEIKVCRSDYAMVSKLKTQGAPLKVVECEKDR